ncbi:cupin domain-containing protein [Flavobacteriaceae bacterium MHTCC 0001]
MNTINIEQKFSELNQYWYPEKVALVDDMQLVMTKIKGETSACFKHENEDKCIQVVKGSLDIVFKEEVKTLVQGELLIIPKGVEYKPRSEKEAYILIFEKWTPPH